MKKFLAPFLHLSKEIYILFFGRIVTSMGSLIWPLLTLILKNKLGYDATEIAVITMIMSVLQFPMLLLGGKLADARNRKWIIVCCDMVTVVCYIIAGCIPLSAVSIVLFYIAGMFATIEGPSYDALVADLSDGDNREQAYSLQYLGMNLGVVNLLPLPALDGGRLVFLIIEGIRRKPVSPKVENVIHTAGLAILMLLMIFICVKDVIKLF